MKQFAPYVIIVLAVTTMALVFFGDTSFATVGSLRQSLAQQKVRNSDLSDNIASLKQEVYGLQTDTRTLEKAARSELGMARPDEIVYLFER